MIETLDKVINGANYSVTQMPAMRAIRMQARLLKLVGPSFAAMIASSDHESDSSLPLALNLLVDKLDEKSFEQLVLDLMQGVRMDGVELTKTKIDLEFAGQTNDLYVVMQFVLEVNFSDFFQPGGIISVLINSMNQKKVSPVSKVI